MKEKTYNSYSTEDNLKHFKIFMIIVNLQIRQERHWINQIHEL